MKIIFLNTWHGQLRDELRTYIQRNLHDTAVFCLQETHGDPLPYDDLFTDEYVQHRAARADEAHSARYDNTIYVRKDIPVTETGGIFLDETNGLNVGMAVFISLKINDKDLTICNVHGAPHPGDKLDSTERLVQSQTIIDTFAGKESVIIGGDFNLLPDTRSVQIFNENGYQDLIADFDIPTTRNRLSHERYPNNIQHYADYAFVSSDIKVVDFVVPTEIVSDHQPLELQVAIEVPRKQLTSQGAQQTAYLEKL